MHLQNISGKEKEMTDNQITIYLDPIAYEKIIEDQKLFKTGKNKSDIIKKNNNKSLFKL